MFHTVGPTAIKAKITKIGIWLAQGERVFIVEKGKDHPAFEIVELKSEDVEQVSGGEEK